jgi:probable rRNA maturation factor
MTLTLEISILSALWRDLPRARAIARETIAACVDEAEIPPREGASVSLCLSDNARVRELNARWRGMDKPTNVLSFPAAPGDSLGETFMLGDIALAYETMADEAETSGVALADHYRHLVAHGFLHLMGYDHQTQEQAGRMEALETRILARLGVADPYADGLVEE